MRIERTSFGPNIIPVIVNSCISPIYTRCVYTIYTIYTIFVRDIYFFFFFWIIDIARATIHRVFIADMPRANWISEMCIRNEGVLRLNERRLRNSVNEEWRR